MEQAMQIFRDFLDNPEMSKTIELSADAEAKKLKKTAEVELTIDYGSLKPEQIAEAVLEDAKAKRVINWQNTNRTKFSDAYPDHDDFVEKLDGQEFTYEVGVKSGGSVNLEAKVSNSEDLEELERIEAAAKARKRELLSMLEGNE